MNKTYITQINSIEFRLVTRINSLLYENSFSGLWCCATVQFFIDPHTAPPLKYKCTQSPPTPMARTKPQPKPTRSLSRTNLILIVLISILLLTGASIGVYLSTKSSNSSKANLPDLTKDIEENIADHIQDPIEFKYLLSPKIHLSNILWTKKESWPSFQSKGSNDKQVEDPAKYSLWETQRLCKKNDSIKSHGIGQDETQGWG